VVSAQWVPLDQAPALLSYKGEKDMAEKAVSAKEL